MITDDSTSGYRMLITQVTQLCDIACNKIWPSDAANNTSDRPNGGEELPLLNAEHLEHLRMHGVSTVAEFLEHEPNFFLHKHRILNAKEYVKLKSYLISKCSNPVTTGHILFRDCIKAQSISPTSCTSIDELLCGGVTTGTITEFCGAAGSGKTQLCLSVASSVALSKHMVIYVDSKGDFSASRLCQILTTKVQQQQNSNAEISDSDAATELPSDIELITAALKRVRVVRCITVEQLLKQLQTIIQRMKSAAAAGSADVDCSSGSDNSRSNVCPQGKVLIIDSITSILAPLLTATTAQGHGEMHEVVQLLKLLTDHYNMAVVMSNQLSHAVALSGGVAEQQSLDVVGGDCSSNSESSKRPSLGSSWQYVPSVRILLYRPPPPRQAPLDTAASTHSISHRCAALIKSNQQVTGKVMKVMISAGGVE